jgi:flagellar protein FlaI
MFKLFNRQRSDGAIPAKKPESTGIEKHPLKLRLELDFLDSAGAGDVDDNKLLILPSAVNAEGLPELKSKSEPEGAGVVNTINGNQKEAVEVQTIPVVERSADAIQKDVILIEAKKTRSELNKPDIQVDIVEVQKASPETSGAEVQRNAVEVENIRREISYLETQPELSGSERKDAEEIVSEPRISTGAIATAPPVSDAVHERNTTLSVQRRNGVSAYQSQQRIHGHDVNLSNEAQAPCGEIQHETGAVLDELFEAGESETVNAVDVKTESRYCSVIPKILELARGDPENYGCKKHSLRKLKKHLMNNGIADISHETLRGIIADNGIKWNGNGYHKKKGEQKEKIIVIDNSPPTLIHAPAPGLDGHGSKEIEIKRKQVVVKKIKIQKPITSSQPVSVRSAGETESADANSSAVIRPYDLFVLNDYVRPSVLMQETEAPSGAVVIESAGKRDKRRVGSAAGADMDVDVDVPPGIESEINNIKSFGADFDPGKLDVIDSYSLPNPIESPIVYIVKDGFKLRYLIKEPAKPAIYSSVRDAILRNIDLYKTSEEDAVARLNSIVDRLKKKYSELKNLSVTEERALRYYLFRDFIGYREIDVPMNDDNIEDITCVGYGIPVFIYHQKYYNLVSDIVLHERELDAMVLRLAQEGGKHISISDPIVDATLRNGTRAQLTFKKTATEKGSTFTLRRFRSSHITPIDLIEKGTYTLEAMAYLWKCVQGGKNILIIGGTATGKTTNLNACSLFIPPEVKIVSIEDTREIKLYQKNWIPSVSTRDIDTFSLLKAALRQRPEYIIVGEVRGKEAQTLFQAMTSGHVVMSTFHAGSVEDLVNRLTSSPIEVPSAMLESLDIVVILKNEWTNTSSRHRFADAIYEQRRIRGVPRFVKIYSHEEGLSASLITPEIEGKIQCLSSLIKEGIRNPDKVSERIISQMYATSSSAASSSTLTPASASGGCQSPTPKSVCNVP